MSDETDHGAPAPGHDRTGHDRTGHEPPAEEVAAFATWLRGATGAAATVDRLERPEKIGHSNETWLVDASVDGEPRELVVRLPPPGTGVFPDYDLSLQTACLRAVRAHSDVPVPEVLWEEPDPASLGRPFYVMARVHGEAAGDLLPYTLGGWLYDATPDEQARVWWATLDVLAAIHAIDWQAAGLGAHLDRREHGPPGVAQQLAHWERYVGWVIGDDAQPTIRAAGGWLRAELPTPSGPVALSWGDARPANVLYRDLTPVAVLDWEMAGLGPAEIDLGWMLFFQDFFSDGLGIDDLPGFPAHDVSIAYYAERAGRPMDDLHWYRVFAAWRHSAIMARLAELWARRGDIPAGTDAAANNAASRVLAAMLDLPSPGPRGGPMG